MKLPERRDAVDLPLGNGGWLNADGPRCCCGGTVKINQFVVLHGPIMRYT